MADKIENKAKIVNNGNDNTYIVNSTIYQDMLSEIAKLMEAGDLSGAMALLERQQKVIATAHPAFPYWMYEITKDETGRYVFGIKPTSPQSQITHPLNGKISVKMTPELQQFGSMANALANAYRTQTPLVVEAVGFETKAGDIPLESMNTNNGETIKITFTPEPFPEPKPFKVYVVDGRAAFDYLMLGASRIEGQDILVLNNVKQQNARIEFEIIINPQHKSALFNMKINPDFLEDVSTQYEFFKFLRDARGKRIGLMELSTGDDMLTSIDCNIEMEGLAEEVLSNHLKFLENLRQVERYFDVDLKIPKGELSDAEISDFDILLHVINGMPVESEFSSMSAVACGKDQVKVFIETYEEHPEGTRMSFEQRDVVIEFCGHRFEFDKVVTEIQSVTIDEIENLKKRYEFMQNEDSLKIVYIPANGQQHCKATMTYYPKGR